MANGFQQDAEGGIRFSLPSYGFGNTTPSINSGYSFDLPLASVQAFANNALSFSRNNAANNQAFLSGVISTSSMSVQATVNQALDYQKKTLDMLGGVSKDASSVVNNMVSRRYKMGCYITTAVCKSRGLPDNCEELTVLRKFRDEYIALLPEGPSLIDEYYRTAPEVVSVLDRDPESERLYDSLYETFIAPAVQAINEGDPEKALRLYKVMVNYTRQIAGV